MTSNGNDPVTGAPKFPEEDALQIGADLEEVAAFAAARGNLLRGTLSQMEAYAYEQEGQWWCTTDTGSLYHMREGNWDLRFRADATATPTLAAGWNAASQNVVTRRNNWALLTFNAARNATAAIGQVAVTVPEGFRTANNVYDQAWGLLGAANTVQVYYDASTNQVKLNQGIAVGQSIAVSMRWPVNG